MLEDLRRNPPKSVRKKNNVLTQNIPDMILTSNQNSSIVIEIKGNNFNIKSSVDNVTEEKVLRALAAFKEELK